MKNVECAFFDLVRLGIYPQATSRFDFSVLSTDDWDKVYELTLTQGVFSLAFDGLQRLDVVKSLPKSFLMEWMAQVVSMEKHSESQRIILKDLVQEYAQHQVRTMLLKGLSLSRLYPHFNHRDGGDFDIYLMGKFQEGNRLMREQGITVKYDMEAKHANFTYKGCSVENHYYFLDRNFSSDMRKCDDRLQDILRKQEVRAITYEDGTVLYLPPVEFNALFLIAHCVMHLICGEAYTRQLCDLSLFFSHYKEDVDVKELFSFLSTLKMYPLVQQIMSLCVDWLGLEKTILPESAYSADVCKKQMTYEYVLYYKYIKEGEMPSKGYIAKKMHRFRCMRLRRQYFNQITGREFLLQSQTMVFVSRARDFLRKDTKK